VLLNEEPLSEVRVYGQALAAEGIPVLAASGDRWMLEELGEGELGSAHLVATKEGQGRARARAYDVSTARAELAGAIEQALAEPLSPPPAGAYPAELRIRVEGVELTRTTVTEPADLLMSIATAFRQDSVSREYRQLAALLPAGDGIARRARRRLGGLLATPVMRAKERSWLARSPSPRAGTTA
jgi:D-aminopeptidase